MRVFSEDGYHLLGRTGDQNSWRVWNVETGKIVASINESVAAAVFAADGRRLISRGDGDLKLWDVGTWQELVTLSGGGGIRWSTDGDVILVAGREAIRAPSFQEIAGSSKISQ